MGLFLSQQAIMTRVKTPPKIFFTGEASVREVVDNGVLWQEWMLLTDGTLSVPRDGSLEGCRWWMCSGGGAGGTVTCYGGGGGKILSRDGVSLSGEIAIGVGIGGRGHNGVNGNDTVSRFGDLGTGYVFTPSDNAIPPNGGSGGGTVTRDLAGGAVIGKGDGKSTLPFGDAEHFEPHCAGGGAGGYWFRSNTGSTSRSTGGDGGENGGNGAAGEYSYSGLYHGGTGGRNGGGNGGNADFIGDDDGATGGSFFGAGGGGRAWYRDMYSNPVVTRAVTEPTPGYQGVVYLRIPLRTA